MFPVRFIGRARYAKEADPRFPENFLLRKPSLKEHKKVRFNVRIF
ncbi:hypothetical protein LEP1GSC052_2764 [Leptospira kmetyi serovar Malaysia str. Bejo-Iso9]|nr:hypothetical protein LEP1GSC052_2764 [Leptospira kmetyi serovar Malaysia str. Bejo-Iso9]